jgi:NADPH:quinone reductase-like Zn-dependent oxidoreductase
VLVHAAAGGVGQLLVQGARGLGATVIGTVGSAAKARIAREAGCAHVIVHSEEDFSARVRELTDGRGADVVYDAIGRDTFARSYEALAVCGHLVSFGQASGPIAPIDIAGYASKSATVSRPNFGHYTDTPQKRRALTDKLFRNLRSGTLRVSTDRRLPLREAASAHRALEGRDTAGSIILIP